MTDWIAMARLAVDPPVDWRGIAYLLGGVLATVTTALGLVIRKLYNDLKSARAELAALAGEQDKFLKRLLEDLQ